MTPCLEQEFQAAAGQMALEPDAVVVVGAVVDLGVLGQVGQDAAVLDARLDLGLEARSLRASRTAASSRSSPSPAGRADGDRFGVMGLEHVEIRAVGDLVGLVEHQERGVVSPAPARPGPP